jgi:hypothetical protein
MNREPMEDIGIQTIYMNNNLEIKKINKELISLTNINSDKGSNKGITKEQLLNILNEKTNRRTPELGTSVGARLLSGDGMTSQNNIPHGKYKLFDSLLYTIDLDPKDIQKYVNGDSNNIGSLKSISMEKDIIIRPSLFIFHSLHSILVLLQETTVEPAMKSIIKSTGQKTSGDGHKHTKKVRIIEPIQNRKPGKMSKTRKHIEK